MITKIFGKKGSVQNHTVGMFIAGAVVWILYLIYVNLLTINFNVNHFVAELTGIPLSWIFNYAINTKLNFDLPFSIKRFGMFCLISAGGWGVYVLTTWLFTDVWQVYSMIGTIVGVGTKTIMNVILQQAITFGKMAKGVGETHKSSTESYDWKSYHFGNPLQKYWKHKIVDYTLGMVGSNPTLDLGCGSSPLLSLIPHVEKHGVDINPEKIKFISGQDNTSKYQVIDGKTPFYDKYFSTVICNEVIEHHPRPNELIKEISRVLKTGGTAIISTPDYSSIIWNVIEVFYGLLMHTGYELEHGSKFTQTGLVALCNAYGLELIRSERVFKCDMVCKFVKYE
jgi:SAM-dependent methyltransferase/putative flippase GtrA